MDALSNMYNKLVQLIAIALLSFTLYSSNTVADEASLMEPLTYQQWLNKLQTKQPNIVVVDMWAMWCVSCLERFPEMVEMHKRYKSDDVVFVSMNLDDRDDKESIEAADKFLRSMNAEFDHYRMDENLMLAFEKTNLMSIPAVLIYDREGSERFRLTGDNPNRQFSKYDIEQAIQSLLHNQ